MTYGEQASDDGGLCTVSPQQQQHAQHYRPSGETGEDHRHHHHLRAMHKNQGRSRRHKSMPKLHGGGATAPPSSSLLRNPSSWSAGIGVGGSHGLRWSHRSSHQQAQQRHSDEIHGGDGGEVDDEGWKVKRRHSSAHTSRYDHGHGGHRRSSYYLPRLSLRRSHRAAEAPRGEKGEGDSCDAAASHPDAFGTTSHEDATLPNTSGDAMRLARGGAGGDGDDGGAHPSTTSFLGRLLHFQLHSRHHRHAGPSTEEPDRTNQRRKAEVQQQAAPKNDVAASVADTATGSTTAKKDLSAHEQHESLLRRIAHSIDLFFHPPAKLTFHGGSSSCSSLRQLKGPAGHHHERSHHQEQLALFLHGCSTREEHEAEVRRLLDLAKGHHGQEGLKLCGFEYRLVKCPVHAGLAEHFDDNGIEDTENGGGAMMVQNEVTGPTNENGTGRFSRLTTMSSMETIDCSSSNHAVASNDDTAGMGSSALAGQSILEEEIAGRTDDGDNMEGSDEPIIADAPLHERLSPDGYAASAARADHQVSRWCPECTTRLHHISTNTIITESNRKRYIADGPMYDEIARLCQEAAQQAMMTEGNLMWVTVCDDDTRGSPVRALVDRGHAWRTAAAAADGAADDGTASNDDNCEFTTAAEQNLSRPTTNKPSTCPTLLIVTGKGKVRAGIFSRQHLLTTGMEPATALPMVREARRRGMRCILLDPNARGDRVGMDTFERSMKALFPPLAATAKAPAAASSTLASPTSVAAAVDDNNNDNDDDAKDDRYSLYVLAHSAAGAQLVRHLLDEDDENKPLLPRIRAIAFTDSTHNIQWARSSKPLEALLQGPECVYLRSATKHHDSFDDDERWHRKRAGSECPEDPFWVRRFGSIRTLWAGTKEHALTNWTAHVHIWHHFDKQMRNVFGDRHEEEGVGGGSHDETRHPRIDGGGGGCGGDGEDTEEAEEGESDGRRASTVETVPSSSTTERAKTSVGFSATGGGQEPQQPHGQRVGHVDRNGQHCIPWEGQMHCRHVRRQSGTTNDETVGSVTATIADAHDTASRSFDGHGRPLGVITL